MKKVLVFELNNYHTEVFPIYENYLPDLLDGEVDIEYYVLEGRLKDLKKVYGDKVHSTDGNKFYYLHSTDGNKFYYFIKLFKLRVFYFSNLIKKIVNKKEPDMVVFNSVEPSINYQIFKNINAKKKMAIIHEPKKFQMRPAKNEQYFVLSENIFRKFESLPLNGYMLPYFPMIEFKEKTNKVYLQIAVQGKIEFNRRDYPFLVEALKRLKKQSYKGIKFNIVGGMNKKDGLRLLNMVKYNGLNDYFIFHNYLDDEKFYKELYESDFIMTLLHENQKQYYYDKTTASLSHSGAYRKPLILSQENAEAWSFDSEYSLIYKDVDDFIDKIKNISNIESLKKNYADMIDKKIEKNKKALKGVK